MSFELKPHAKYFARFREEISVSFLIAEGIVTHARAAKVRPEAVLRSDCGSRRI